MAQTNLLANDYAIKYCQGTAALAIWSLPSWNKKEETSIRNLQQSLHIWV